jgi:5S rRNA maturation endonuclease (ribonuclease M5)
VSTYPYCDEQGKVVCICEGEEDVHTLVQHGYAATCNSQGAGKWTDAHSEHLRGADDVVIFGDHDEAGRRHVKQVVASLRQVGLTPRVAQMEELPEHGDVRDWLKMLTPEDLDRLIAEAPMAGEAPNDPSATGDDLDAIQVPQWPTLHEKALYGLAGDIMRTIAPHTEADSAALLIQFLTFFGNAIGNGSHCQAEANRHALNEYTVLVGSTSKARKGTSEGHVRRL